MIADATTTLYRSTISTLSVSHHGRRLCFCFRRRCPDAVVEEGTKAVVAMRREGRGGWVVWVEGWRVDGGRRWAQAKVGRVVVRVVVRVEYGEGGHIHT